MRAKMMARIALVVCCLALLSCPNPLDKAKLLHVKDAIGPVITISSPADGNYCAKTLIVTGTVADSATATGDSGEVGALSYEVLSTSISGDVEVGGVVALGGNFAYVADGSSGLQIIDISDPTSLTLAGSCPTPSDAWGVAVSGAYAYIAGDASGLQVIDVSNPAVPTLVGCYDTPGNAYGVAVSGNFAYVADYEAGLRIFDISNPGAPVFVGTCDTPGWATGVVVSGDLAFVSDWYAGLQVIRLVPE